MAALFHKGKTDTCAVVGRMRGEEIDVLRVSRGGGQVHVHGATTVSWESGAALGEPLERLVGWRPNEPLIIAVPTPALVGGSITIRRPRLSTDNQVLVDPRELTLRAHWEAREALREEAAAFLGCALEDVSVFREDVRPWEDAGAADELHTTVTTFFQGPTAFHESIPVRPTRSGFQWSPPIDVPTCDMVVLPVFLSELFSSSTESVGLLVSEETRLSFLVRHEHAVRHVRTAPLGSTLLIDTIVRALSCSPREAEHLLQRADASGLTSDGIRVLTRVFRPLLPVYRTALQLFAEHLPPKERPTRIVIAGFWPTLFHRLFFHSTLALFPPGHQRALQLLPRPTLATDGPPQARGARMPESVYYLLEHLAEGALRRYASIPAESARVPAR
ncbi:MAG: hypothetical protein G01um1014106_172 [Parcubacteria group bacterium Gr01-1014_106]|nr:MAG: hypothetical protein G01um1014106_172 [Parcubacteria group bacterium Gr01-1014_106]